MKKKLVKINKWMDKFYYIYALVQNYLALETNEEYNQLIADGWYETILTVDDYDLVMIMENENDDERRQIIIPLDIFDHMT